MQHLVLPESITSLMSNMTRIVFSFSRTYHIKGTTICSTCEFISFTCARKNSKSTFHWWDPNDTELLYVLPPSHWSESAAAAAAVESGHTHTQNQQCEIKSSSIKASEKKLDWKIEIPRPCSPPPRGAPWDFSPASTEQVSKIMLGNDCFPVVWLLLSFQSMIK
jgi:hypothetical protein